MNNNYRYQSMKKKRKGVNKHNRIAHKNNECHKISSNKKKYIYMYDYPLKDVSLFFPLINQIFFKR
jgi:hypothetical protein